MNKNPYQAVRTLHVTIQNTVPGSMVSIPTLIAQCEQSLIESGLYSDSDLGRIISYEYNAELQEYALKATDESLAAFIQSLYSPSED